MVFCPKFKKSYKKYALYFLKRIFFEIPMESVIPQQETSGNHNPSSKFFTAATPHSVKIALWLFSTPAPAVSPSVRISF